MKKILLSLFLLTGVCYADGIQDLEYFLQQKNNSISADFIQTVYGNRKNKISSGTMQIQRPNKFRWQYKEDGQLIVSDSKNIYIYDEPLQQVTKRRLTNSLGKSPALLLAGGSDIKKYYKIKNLSDNNNLQWVELIPKDINDNNGFKVIDMGFNKTDHSLAIIKFIDNFEHKSSIVFTNLKYNNQFNPDIFNFKPPKGVDVVDADASIE